MTESEWQVWTSPRAWLDEMRRRGGTSPRKLRLFAAACYRRVWHLLRDPADRHAVEVAEAYADGEATWEVLARAGEAAGLHTCRAVAFRSAWESAWGSARDAASVARTLHGSSGWIGEQRPQLALLRDLLGNPFRPVVVDPAWLLWRDGLAVRTASAIYANRWFEELPILGDLLVDAGCSDAEILDHCHGGGEHARGCFVLDALLGKV